MQQNGQELLDLPAALEYAMAEIRETLPQRDVKREPSLKSCPLTSRGVLSHMHVVIFTYIHAIYRIE